MILEGQLNWVLILGVVAGAAVLLALLAMWGSAMAGMRLARTTGERDAALAAQDSAERRLFEMLNAIPVALVETDVSGRFVFANRAAHQLLGRRDAELIGLRFHSATWGITYPDGRPIPPDLLPSARALRGQTVKGFQHILANPANRKRMLVSVTAMPILNGVGQVIGSTAAIVETESMTTPLVEPEVAAPAAADPIARRVFDAASSALVVIDGEGRILDANPTALERLGGETATGRDFTETFVDINHHVEARQAIRAAFGAEAGQAEPLMLDGYAWRFLPLATEEGEEPALLLAGDAVTEPAEAEEPRVAAIEPAPAQPVETDTVETGAVAETAALRAELDRSTAEAADLRARLDAEMDAARREREAGRRMEDVGRLTGGVAHDVSSLLGVMTTALDLMLKQADDPAKVRRLGQAALTAGQRGEVLTRRLSAFSEGSDAAASRMDVGVLLRGMEPALRAAASDVDLMIETPSEPLEADIDPVLFDGAVRALVDNAVEAAREAPGGAVAVRIQPDPDGAVRLTVRDNGPGMTPDVIARASEPFFTTREGSAGLGLAQAYAFARQAGGRLMIDSQPGDGSEIAVVLPAPPKAADAA